MSDYSLKNLHDIDDAFAERGLGMEGRFARAHLNSEHLGVSLFRYAPNFRAPFGHSHREQEEAYVVVSGSGRVRLGEEVIELRQWDALRVAPSVVRAFEGGPDGMETIVVGGDRPEGGDGERVQNFWTD